MRIARPESGYLRTQCTFSTILGEVEKHTPHTEYILHIQNVKRHIWKRGNKADIKIMKNLKRFKTFVTKKIISKVWSENI